MLRWQMAGNASCKACQYRPHLHVQAINSQGAVDEDMIAVTVKSLQLTGTHDSIYDPKHLNMFLASQPSTSFSMSCGVKLKT